jgi:ABC-2 type transport system permease protein
MTTTPFPKAVRALTRRWFWHLKREPAGLVSSLLQPALWLILFGSLFENSSVVSGYSYISFMTAGVVVMTVFNAAISGGVEILFDRESEFLERLIATPCPVTAILLSRFIFIMTISILQAFIILAVALVMGVQVAANWIGLILILFTGILLGAGIAAISMTMALGLKGHGQFFSIIGFISLPMTFASTALAPIEAMPPWLRFISKLNPLTYAIDTIRSLILTGVDASLIGQMTGVLLAFVAFTVTILVFVSKKTID